MASLAATTGLGLGLGCGASCSTRVLVVPPIQQHRRTICCSAAKQRNQSVLCVSGGQQRNGAPVVISSSIPKQHTQSDDGNGNMLSGSTRTVTTLFGMALLCVKAFAKVLPPPNLCLSTVSVSTGSLFFAAIRTRRGYLNTPMTVVAAGLKKWLDIYSGVLMVRVLLSWFPNIPWERQPLSAIRDLCDPYLSLFRNIIPPVFDTLDVSPLLAFAVLGSLAKLLSATTI